MQFSDPLFLFAFLPATLAAYFLCGLWSSRLAMLVLVAASLYFFSFAGLDALAVLAGSMVVNYGFGSLLIRPAFEASGAERKQGATNAATAERGRAEPGATAAGSPIGQQSIHGRRGLTKRGKVVLLWIGVVANLGLLGYFKYRGFFLDNLATALGSHAQSLRLWVPLGVSFYTFQKVAFLVDAHRGKIKQCGPIDFALFSTFFPQVTSGPITRAQEMFPQFDALSARFNAKAFTEGLSIFIVGLAKKMLIADTMGAIAGPAFDSFSGPHAFGIAGVWVGVVAYAMQIYYDFSGYSEMALGLAKMVNLKLPCNFNAPYKANSMIGFWARWHMSLSRWLRDYVFLSIANPFHAGKRIVGMFVTMVICGLWHGAQWTFVVWGGLHGAFLAVNHAWRELAERYPGQTAAFTSKRMKPLGRLITFAAVTGAWVFFRAPTIAIASKMLGAMIGSGTAGATTGFSPYPAVLVLAVTCYTFLVPDTIAVFSRSEPCLEKMPVVKTRFQWSPGWPSAAIIGLLVFLIVRSHMVAAESVRFTYSNF